jgi:hypothetical protein
MAILTGSNCFDTFGRRALAGVGLFFGLMVLAAVFLPSTPVVPVDRTGPDGGAAHYLARVVKDTIICARDSRDERHTAGQIALKHDDSLGIWKAGCKPIGKNTRLTVAWSSRDGFSSIETSGPAEPKWFMWTLDLERDHL